MKYQKVFPLIGCGIAMICLAIEIERVRTREPRPEPLKPNFTESKIEFNKAEVLTYAFPPYCPSYKSSQQNP